MGHTRPLETVPDGVSNDGHGHIGRHDALGSDWLLEARKYMLSGSSAKNKRLIGKLYRAGEDIADNSEQGLCHPDAKAYFRAYAQAIDAGKHGNCIHLPEHLRAKVGL